MNEEGTHIPILCKAFEQGDGPILEMGAGLFSTAILDMLCKVRQKRHILTLENDREWYEQTRENYQSDYHDVVFVEDWDKAPVEDTFWGLVLIDHRPSYRRVADIIRLKHKAYYILVHDSELADHKVYRYDKALSHFRYHYDYKECLPNTMVFSNYSPLQELSCPR